MFEEWKPVQDKEEPFDALLCQYETLDLTYNMQFCFLSCFVLLFGLILESLHSQHPIIYVSIVTNKMMIGCYEHNFKDKFYR